MIILLLDQNFSYLYTMRRFIQNSYAYAAFPVEMLLALSKQQSRFELIFIITLFSR